MEEGKDRGFKASRFSLLSMWLGVSSPASHSPSQKSTGATAVAAGDEHTDQAAEETPCSSWQDRHVRIPYTQQVVRNSPGTTNI